MTTKKQLKKILPILFLSLCIMFILVAEQFFSVQRTLLSESASFSLSLDGRTAFGPDNLTLSDNQEIGEISLLAKLILRTIYLWLTLFPCLVWISKFKVNLKGSKKLIGCLRWVIGFALWYFFMKHGETFYNDVCLRYIIDDGTIKYYRWIFCCLVFTICVTDWKSEHISEFRQKVRNGWHNLVFPPQPIKSGRILNFFQYILDRNTFFHVGIGLFITWSLYALFQYPGIMMGDTWFYYASYHGIDNNYTNSVVLLSPDQTITNHHSVLYTYLMNSLGDLSVKYTGTVNLGFYLCNLIILAIFAFIVAYAFTFLKRKNVSIYLRIFAFLTTCLYLPYIQFTITLMKDVGYAAFFLLFTICTLEFYYDEKWLYSKKNISLFLISTIGMLLFRKNGFFVLVISTTALLFIYKNRKTKLIVFALLTFVVLFQGCYKKVVLPSLNIADSSPREMLSVPFQQTARYVKEYPDEVTSKEKKAIESILDYENLSELYAEDISDPVKDTFNKYASSEDLKNYFKVWLEMFFKHPLCYLEAYWNNYNNYFIPAEYTEAYTHVGISNYSTLLKEYDCNISIIKNRLLLKLYNWDTIIANILVSTPYWQLLFNTATYTWLIISLIVYSVYKRNWSIIPFLLPTFIALVINCLGPVDGVNFRYTYPSVIPIVILIILTPSKKYKHYT